jgi:hypothetical protein
MAATSTESPQAQDFNVNLGAFNRFLFHIMSGQVHDVQLMWEWQTGKEQLILWFDSVT